MLKRLLLALSLLLAPAAALAQSSSLGNLSAVGSVASADLFYDVKTVGSGGLKATAAQIATFVLTPTVTISLGTITTNVTALNITGTFNAAGTTFDAPILANITNTASASGSLLMDLQAGAGGVTSMFSVNPNGFINVATNAASGGAANNLALNLFNGRGGFYSSQGAQLNFAVNGKYLWAATDGTQFISGVAIGANSGLSFDANTTGTTVSADATLYRDAVASVVALGSAANHIGFRIYNTTDQTASNTAPTNFERGALDWTTTANTFTVGTQAGGTGVKRTVAISPANGHTTFTGGSAPTANTCAGFALGTGSSDGQGLVTFTSATSCSITFGTAYGNAPFCTITPGSAASTSEVVTTTTGFTATFGTAQTALYYHCTGS